MLDITIHIVTRPNLRDREFHVFIGQKYLKDIYDTDKDLSDLKVLELEHPERWLNILELRALPSVLAVRCPNLEKLYIRTSNEHILTVYPHTVMGIIDKPSDFPEVKYTTGVRYCPEIEDAGLLVFGGKIHACDT